MTSVAPCVSNAWTTYTQRRKRPRFSWRTASTEQRRRYLRRHIDERKSGCWYWTGPTNSAGYGRVPGGGLAHRAAYALAHPNAIITGAQLHHSCHTKRCVNPNHLLVLSGAEHAALHHAERGTYESYPHCG